MNEMKKILLIGTGGTIASDVTDSGLAPELTTEQLLSHIPGISDICGVDCLQLLNLDSTNMTPAHWLEIAACIREHYQPIRRLCHHPRHGHHGVYGGGPELSDPG